MEPNHKPILLAEDDPSSVLLTRRAFRKCMVARSIQVVEDGEETMAYLAGRGKFADRACYPLPDILLLDLKLPRVSGFEVLAWLRGQPEFAELPVVVLTSSRELDDIKRSFELGANSFLAKPVTPEALEEMMSNFTVNGMGKAGVRLILIEDDPGQRGAIRHTFAATFPNLTIQLVNSPQELSNLDLASAIVLTGDQLHWSDGLSVMRSIKARAPSCPVIMLTSPEREEMALKAMKAGLDDYVLTSAPHFSRLPMAVRLASGRLEYRRAVREAETRYQSLFENVPVGLYTTFPDGQIVDGNAAMLALLRFPDKVAALGHVIADLYLNAESYHQTQEVLRRDGAVANFETQMRRSDGESIWVEQSIHAVRGADGQVQSHEGSLMDITARKKAEAEILELNAQLERRVVDRTAQLEDANKELEAFAYSVSHDLRAPLSLLNRFSNLLLQDYAPELTSEAQNYVRLIHQSAQQMDRLVADILRLSRTSRQALKMQAVDQAVLVREVIAELRTNSENRRIDIVIGDLPDGQGDPGLLKQVWANLLSNAFKFTRSREVARIEIGCTTRPDKTGVVFFVKDNGVGFDMAGAGTLFGLFQRMHSEEDFEGNGIGLAIAKRIVQRHGGDIWAEAEPDKGASFYFTLGGG